VNNEAANNAVANREAIPAREMLEAVSDRMHLVVPAPTHGQPKQVASPQRRDRPQLKVVVTHAVAPIHAPTIAVGEAIRDHQPDVADQAVILVAVGNEEDDVTIAMMVPRPIQLASHAATRRRHPSVKRWPKVMNRYDHSAT
jgi:hypothetical protein